MSYKMRCIPILSTGLVVFFTVCLIAGMGGETMPGGSSATSVTKKEVVAASSFAIKAEQKALREKKDSPAAKLELVRILSAEEQVVAGMNYRLKLKVKLDGKEKEAEAVVWWQAWRTPDPYQLTSWDWKQADNPQK